MRVLTILTVVSFAGSASAADLCRGPDGKWSFGGVGFDAAPEAVKALAKPGPGCEPNSGGYCKTSADGIQFVLDQREGKLVHKERALAASETLPFGIVPGDTLDEAGKKVVATGTPAGVGSSWSKPVSIVAFCGQGLIRYTLEFRYGKDGKLAALTETDSSGPGLYTDDVTYSINPIEH